MAGRRFSAITAVMGYLLATSLALLPACDQAAEEATLSAPPASAALAPTTAKMPTYDYYHDPNSPMLPAYNERRFAPKLLKVDQFDDIRAANPENFAITEPPAVANFRAMVEWEPMHAIIMEYPSYMAGSQNASETVAKIAMHTATVADVWFIVDGQAAINSLNTLMQQVGMSNSDIQNKVHFYQDDIDSIWFIDSGPVPIIDLGSNTYAFSDFVYYHQRAYDDGIPSKLGRNLTQFGLPSATETFRMPVSTEGGTFQSTTDGICFTGSRQLYNMSCAAGGCDNSIESQPLATLQNHALTQELELYWGQYLGCKDVIVTYSITDDGTGHIDMYLKVIDDNTVMIGEYVAPFDNSTPQAINAQRMDANAAFIEAYVKPGGGGFTSPRIIMPGHRTDNFGTVPFTYINSTFINGLNLWPATEYADWMDSRTTALGQWQAAMPSYNHQYIDSTELSFWSGAIHCITRTVPDMPPGKWVGDGTCNGGDCSAPTGGYDGACTPGTATTSPVCWGPAWLCECNDCASGCSGPGPDNCNGITYQGCCTGAELTYCDMNALVTQQCAGQGCGWVAGSGWYDCGGNGADPSGQFSLQCPVPCTPDCDGKQCGGDDCGGSCGACPSGESCNAGGTCDPCVPVCDGLACGPDGCGSTCGDCGAGETCNNGACEACVPQCDGKQCGADGCGGDCGACPAGESCLPGGECSGGGGDNGGTPDDAGDSGGAADAGPTDNGGPGTDNGGPGTDNGGPGADNGGRGADNGTDNGNGNDITGTSDSSSDTFVPVGGPGGGSNVGCEVTNSASNSGPAPLLGWLALLGLLLFVQRREV